jgi:H+/Cl- antiporter ClcA
VGLAKLSDFAQALFFRSSTRVGWLPAVLTPLGFALSAFVTRHWFRNAEGSGIPQAIAAHRTVDLSLRNSLVAMRVAVGKVLLTALGLVCGASVGREGPTVQIGASIMYAAGRRTPRKQSSLIVAGAAAGVAAAFNAPLAGILFAIEEMSRSFEKRSAGLMISAVIAAGFTAMAFLGNYTYFGTTSGSVHNDVWIAVAICGVAGGIAGGAFSKILVSASGSTWRRMARMNTKWGAIVFAALCGIGVVLCGTISGGAVYGTGYAQVSSALHGGQPLSIWFGMEKYLATLCSSLSGIPGGIFSPSLAVGAGIGADVACYFAPQDTSIILVLGMVAYLSGVVQAPMTSFVIVMEMTDDHAALIPLMAAALIAYGTSRAICEEGIYHALARNVLKRASAPAATPT